MLKFKNNKLSIVLLIIILLLTFFLTRQHRIYKETINNYDTSALIKLSSSLEYLIECSESNELTQDIYIMETRLIKNTLFFMHASPNIRFMSDGTRELIDYENKEDFEQKSLKQCKKLHEELKRMIRTAENHKVNTFYYFKNAEQKSQFYNKYFDTY